MIQTKGWTPPLKSILHMYDTMIQKRSSKQHNPNALGNVRIQARRAPGGTRERDAARDRRDASSLPPRPPPPAPPRSRRLLWFGGTNRASSSPVAHLVRGVRTRFALPFRAPAQPPPPVPAPTSACLRTKGANGAHASAFRVGIARTAKGHSMAHCRFPLPHAALDLPFAAIGALRARDLRIMHAGAEKQGRPDQFVRAPLKIALSLPGPADLQASALLTPSLPQPSPSRGSCGQDSTPRERPRHR